LLAGRYYLDVVVNGNKLQRVFTVGRGGTIQVWGSDR
jgi:hypothetical protein